MTQQPTGGDALSQRLRRAWEGRISGCQLGKPVETLSMLQGYDALKNYLASVGSFPVRDYIGYRDVAGIQRECCRGELKRSEPDDDINYSVIALLLLEQSRRANDHGRRRARVAEPVTGRRHVHRRARGVSGAAAARAGSLHVGRRARLRSRGMLRQQVQRLDRGADSRGRLRLGLPGAARSGG